MFDERWEAIHAARPWGSCPSEHLVRFVKRTFPDPRKNRLRSLELGCGAGAQSMFLAVEGFSTHAVDGSQSAIERLWRKTPLVRAWRADIVELVDMQDRYDLIVDVCALQHLPLEDATTVVQRALQWLNPSGWFFSLMAGEHHVINEGSVVPRMTTFPEIEAMFKGYVIHTGHVDETRTNGDVVAHWIIEAQAP